MCSFVVTLADKFLETSVDDAVDSRQLHKTPTTTGDDSPIRQVQRRNIALNLPDWQPVSAAEPAQDSPITDIAPSDLPWPPVKATEYQDQPPVTESPVQPQQKSDIASQPVNWQQLDKPTKKSTGDSPILQVRKKNIALDLPDWQPTSAVEPAEDSPITDIAPSELAWPPVVASEYSDQQPIAEEPVAAQMKSDISSEPVVNWERLDKPATTAPPPASFPNVTKQIVEGEIYETEEKNETSERPDDGSECTVRRLVTTRRQLLPVTELTLENGVEVSRTTSDVVVAVHVDESVDILPHGVDDLHASGLETVTSVQESEEPLKTGGTLKRRVTTRTVRQLQAPEISPPPEGGVEVMHDGKIREGD